MGSKRVVTIGSGEWVAHLVNGDVFEVRTRSGDVVAFEEYIRIRRRGTVAENAVDGQCYTVWRALRRLGKVPPESAYEAWRDEDLDYLERIDDVPADPTGPGRPPG